MSADQPWAPGCVDSTAEIGYADAAPGSRARFPGFFLASASAVDDARLPDHSWVEVMHVARDEDHRDEESIASEGQFWYWLAPGSGIFLNLGRALRSPTVGVSSPGCRHAVGRGYDTILITQPDDFGSGMVEAADGRVRYGTLPACVAPTQDSSISVRPATTHPTGSMSGQAVSPKSSTAAAQRRALHWTSCGQARAPLHWALACEPGSPTATPTKRSGRAGARATRRTLI